MVSCVHFIGPDISRFTLALPLTTIKSESSTTLSYFPAEYLPSGILTISEFLSMVTEMTLLPSLSKGISPPEVIPPHNEKGISFRLYAIIGSNFFRTVFDKLGGVAVFIQLKIVKKLSSPKILSHNNFNSANSCSSMLMKITPFSESNFRASLRRFSINESHLLWRNVSVLSTKLSSYIKSLLPVLYGGSM